jgi:hypothetical protein
MCHVSCSAAAGQPCLVYGIDAATSMQQTSESLPQFNLPVVGTYRAAQTGQVAIAAPLASLVVRQRPRAQPGMAAQSPCRAWSKDLCCAVPGLASAAALAVAQLHQLSSSSAAEAAARRLLLWLLIQS